MRELTKQERHEIYKEALRLFETNDIQSANGICNALQVSSSEVLGYRLQWGQCCLLNNRDGDCVFEELFCFLPNDDYNNVYWAEDDEIRKIVLMFCIEMSK